jgi:hypothetical protein
MFVSFAEWLIISEYPVVASPHFLLISFSFYFQVNQLAQICSCCLLDEISSTDRHKRMKTEAFIHQIKRVSFIDAYSDVNGCPPVSAESICETCTNLLESAYVFRQTCRVANQSNDNVCRCCFQEKSERKDQFLNMKNAVFEHNNKRVTFYEGYFEVKFLEDSATFTNFDASICEDCAMQLESAYAFRRMCQKTAEILKQTSERKQNKENFLRKLQYHCKECPKAFQTRYLRAIHVYKEHLIIIYDCKDCDKVFKTSASLRQHKLGHGKSLHQCGTCPKAYRRRTILLQHIKTKHENIRLACQDCDKTFTSLSGLHHHKTTIHLNKLFKCKVCYKICKNITCLQTHINFKHLNRTFQCEKCSKIYLRKDDFIVHYQSKHLHIVFACQDCEKVFTSRSGLTFHNTRIHLKILHQCEQCPKTFCDKRTLRTHVENIHEKKQYSCQDCKKVFKTQSGLTVHKNIIHLKKLLKCKKCEKTFINRSARDLHNAKEHLMLTFECQKCKKNLANKKTLSAHMRKIHPNDP